MPKSIQMPGKLSAKGRRHARNIARSAKRRTRLDPCFPGTDNAVKDRGRRWDIIGQREKQTAKIGSEAQVEEVVVGGEMWDMQHPRFSQDWQEKLAKIHRRYRPFRQWRWLRIYAVLFWLSMPALIIYLAVR